MSHEIEKFDQYVYVKMTSAQFDFNNTEQFLKSLNELSPAQANLILNCKQIASISESDILKIKDILFKSQLQSGIVVISELQDEFVGGMELMGFTCIPTDDEAIDFVYMTQLEREIIESDLES